MAEKTVRLVRHRDTGVKLYVYTAMENMRHNSPEPVDIPCDMIVGLAYPTLEDSLSQPITFIEVPFAMVRDNKDDWCVKQEKTKQQELAEAIHECTSCSDHADQCSIKESLDIIYDARERIDACFSYLINLVEAEKLVFLGCNFGFFKERLIDLAVNGGIGYVDLNGMNSEERVAHQFGTLLIRQRRHEHKIPLEQKGTFRYGFRRKESLERIRELEGHSIMREVFVDLKEANLDDATYQDIDSFKKYLSDKWLGLLRLYRECITNAMCGTSASDYDYPESKWQETTLCKAIRHEFQELERQGRAEYI